MTRRAIVLSALLVLAVAACDWSGDPVEREDPAEIAFQNRMKEGKASFVKQGCIQCHVIDEDDYAAKEGPDLTYYDSRRARDSAYAKRVMDPSSEIPKDFRDHPKVVDPDIRRTIAQWLAQGQQLKDYVSPRHDRSIALGQLATDPVVGVEVLKETALSTDYGGTRYYFATPSSMAKFNAHPAHYIE
jgi:YHS domain-containing protein